MGDASITVISSLASTPSLHYFHLDHVVRHKINESKDVQSIVPQHSMHMSTASKLGAAVAIFLSG